MSSELHILIFRTNIRSKKDLNAVDKALSSFPDITRWNVDRQDIDKVLRIESVSHIPHEIISSVQSAGYACSELED